MAATLSYGEAKRSIHFKTSESMEKRIKNGRRNINISEEIRRLLELGLQAEGR